MKKNIYRFALLTAVAIAGLFFYQWNKPHRDINNETTTLVTAAEITRLFEADEALASKKYLNKALTIRGITTDISSNDIGEQVILLKGADELSGVQCTLSQPTDVISKTDTIEISGFCNGFTTVVILDDCKILKK